MKSVTAVENSDNAKTGPVSATYAGRGSCPDSCPFAGRENGCYAEDGFVGHQFRRLSRPGERDALKLAREEAKAIDALTGDRLLRLHVSGDCKTAAAASVLAHACLDYTRRGATARMGKKVWAYTHAWRDVPREAWGASVSVLASVETPQGAKEAMQAGYAAAVVVAAYERPSAYELGGVKVLPCPYQTRGVQCRDCRLCLDDERLLRAGIVIAFEAHGRVAGVRARRVLTSLL